MSPGTFEGDSVWYSTYDSGEEEYIVVINAGNTAETVSLPVSGDSAELLCGDYRAALEGGLLTLQISPKATVYFKIVDNNKPGIFCGNIYYRNLPRSKVYVSAPAHSIAALYIKNGNAWDLLSLYKNGDSFMIEDNREYKFNIFNWSNMKPMTKSFKAVTIDY